jgi:excisionase family DNA binding protein
MALIVSHLASCCFHAFDGMCVIDCRIPGPHVEKKHRNSHRFDWTLTARRRKTGRVNEITLEAEATRPHQDLTALEAARLLGVSKLHVIDLLEAGEIDYHMVGTDLMFNAAEIESYKSDREHRDSESLVSA